MAVREISTSGRRTLAWIWGRSPYTIPIPGFKELRQVQENACAMAFGPLAQDQMQEVEALLGQ